MGDTCVGNAYGKGIKIYFWSLAHLVFVLQNYSSISDRRTENCSTCNEGQSWTKIISHVKCMKTCIILFLSSSIGFFKVHDAENSVKDST